MLSSGSTNCRRVHRKEDINDTRHTQVRAHTWPGCCRVALEWQIWPTLDGGLVATAEAVVGRPATPVSYAGVARRSTVGAGAPGVGVTPGVGAGAPGVGVTPGVGAGAPGVGAAPGNLGGPVNRVGCAEQAHAAERLGLDVYAAYECAGDTRVTA